MAFLFGLSMLLGSPVIAQEVNLRNANLFYSHDDMLVQKPGVALEISRTYNSRSNVEGAFGYGWTTNLDIVCQEGPDGSVLVTDSDGFILRYTLEGEPKERLTARYVERIIAERRQEDQRSGTLRSDATYADLARQLLEDPVLRANTGFLLPDAWADATPGSYLSFDRGTERLTKREDGTYVRIRSDGVRYEFDSDGRLRRFVDAGKRGMRLDYDKTGRLVKVSHSQGGTITLSWGGQGRVVGLLDTQGGRVSYQYSPGGDLVKVMGPGEKQFAYTYDNLHNLTAAREADGEGFQVTYDTDRDWVTGLKDGKDITRYGFSLYDEGHEVVITDPSGATRTHRYYDAEHRHVVTDESGGETETLLSECCDKPLEVRGPKGEVTRYEYDRQARLVGVEHPDGKKVRYAYHPKWSKIMQALYSDGRRFLYSYDDVGNLVEAAARGSRTLALTYGQNGKVDVIRDANGESYSFRYDPAGRPLEIRKGSEGALGIRYGVMGEIAGTEIREGDVTRADFYSNLREVLDLLEPATGEVQ